MSWIWPDYISSDLPLTAKQRADIRRGAWRLWWARKWNLALYLALPTFYLLAVLFVSDVAGWTIGLLGIHGMPHRVVRAAAPIILLLVCFIGGGAVLQRCRFAPCVYQALRQHGYDVCRRCGYWLKGLDAETSHCPECGAPREPAASHES